MRKSLKLILLFTLLILLVWKITISYSLIRERKQRKNQPTPDKQSRGTLLTDEDRKLGVAAITEREDYATYVIPAMVKLIPRETTLGVKDECVTGIPGEILSIFAMNPPGYGDIRRTVKLKPYWIGRYEVTLGEFQKFLDDTSKKREEELLDGEKQLKPNRPVVGLYRRQAIKYCEWLSKKTGMKFRLPTEDEWEYAARSGYEQKPTPYGDEMPFEYKRPYQYSSIVVPYGKKENFDWNILYGFIHNVGSYPPTRYHLYDMGGNIMEWTYHDYAPDIYRIKDASFTIGYRVYGREVEKEDFARVNLGFRLVREVDD